VASGTHSFGFRKSYFNDNKIMAGRNFVDYVKICCRSGAGGAGSAHLHRAKYQPRGGPDGGDGGRGGHIILRGNRNMWTLLPLKYRKHVIAGQGQNGHKNNMTGADGEDVFLMCHLEP
jgi:GTP-binding protein